MTAVRNHVALADVSDRGKIFVEGGTAEAILPLASPLSIGEGVVKDGRAVFRLRQDQFFVSTEAEDTDTVTAELTESAQKAEGLVTVTDLTHGRSQLLVIGPKAGELLGRLCGLNFHSSQFPNLSARQSSVAKTRQLILRQDIEDYTAYVLIGSRSLAAYLWQTILEAGRDLSIQPIGQQTVDGLK